MRFGDVFRCRNSFLSKCPLLVRRVGRRLRRGRLPRTCLFLGRGPFSRLGRLLSPPVRWYRRAVFRSVAAGIHTLGLAALPRLVSLCHTPDGQDSRCGCFPFPSGRAIRSPSFGAESKSGYGLKRSAKGSEGDPSHALGKLRVEGPPCSEAAKRLATQRGLRRRPGVRARQFLPDTLPHPPVIALCG